MKKYLEQVLSGYLETIKRGIESDEMHGVDIISLPFFSPDGHFIEISIKQLQGGYVHLSNMENEISDLFLRGMDITPQVRELIKDIVTQYNLQINDDEIFTIVKLNQAGAALHNMMQALLRISDLIFLHSKYLNRIK